MKHFLLLIASMLSLGCFAQTLSSQKIHNALSANPSKQTQGLVVNKAPRKALAANQQYMGQYTSDKVAGANEGIGLKSYPGVWSIVAFLPSDEYSAYDGGKVVGMRAGLAESVGQFKLFVLGANDDGSSIQCDTLSAKTVDSSVAGWNEVTFDTPFNLDMSKYDYIGIGYTYTQNSTAYPISVVAEGTAGSTLLYGTISNYGTGWYDFSISDYGNLSVQAIVEKDFAKTGVSALSFADSYVQLGSSTSIEVPLINVGTDGVESVDYTVTRNSGTSEEQHLDVSPKVTTFSGAFTINVPVEAAQESGKENVSVTITKVNGVANTANNNVAKGKLITVKKLFTHRVAVEEFTGTGCGWCPRGMQGMENLRETFGDSFIGIGIHQYTKSTASDAMYIPTANYQSLTFGGAPSCMIERGDVIDPYYGASNDIRDDFSNALKAIAPVGVEVAGQWSSDKTTVSATATVEALVDGNEYDIEYVLVADSLTGTTTAWKQANYYYQYSQAQVPSDLKQFANGGKFGVAKFSGWAFNDVAIASSFVSSKNTATPLGVLAAYTPVNNACTLNMPTTTALVNALHYDKVYIVALVVDKATGKIANAAKSTIDECVDGIEDVNVDAPMKSNKVYNLAGQRVNGNAKGIVIINGKKYVK